MTETEMMYDRFLEEFERYLLTRSKRRRTVLNPLVLFERLFNWVLKAFVQAVDSLVLAIIR
jgi:hypothetical protein